MTDECKKIVDSDNGTTYAAVGLGQDIFGHSMVRIDFPQTTQFLNRRAAIQLAGLLLEYTLKLED